MMARTETSDYWKTIDVQVRENTAYAIQQKEVTCLYRSTHGVTTTSERRDEHRVIEVDDIIDDEGY